MGSRDDAFEVFVSTRYRSLLRAARVVADDHADAEDLLQSALVRTYTHWSSIRDPGAAEAYCHTTLVRLAIRSRGRRWRGERASAEVPELAGPDEYAARDDEAVVMSALASLPVEQRAVLVLRYYGQLSETEIARALNCPVGTVKSRAHLALTALRRSGLLASHETETADD